MSVCTCVQCVNHRRQYRVGNSPRCLRSSSRTTDTGSSFDDSDFAIATVAISSSSSDDSSSCSSDSDSCSSSWD